MRRSITFLGLKASLALFFATIFVTGADAAERQERVVHSFGAGKDGNQVNASLVLDPAGNLYGTTTGGGTYNSGTAYELSFQPGAGWKETRLHDFGLTKGDGSLPAASLTLDAAGNLYGTATQGGTYGCGVVFKLSRNTTGSWTEKILHNFACSGGFSSYSSLILDSNSNLYGTTYYGGTYGEGSVYELSPMIGGAWTQTTLHSFNFATGDGDFPFSSLNFDESGNLYGTTWAGGPRGGGTVYCLAPTADGHWTETVLYGFAVGGNEGSTPATDLIFDAAGNLYGTTTLGGAYGKGVVFELSPSGKAVWTETVVHNFEPNGLDGFVPYAGLVRDSAGNLYGTTTHGGSNWAGVVFELTPLGDGLWTEKILHSFRTNGIDGTSPFLGVTVDPLGNLYGTTTDGGVYSSSGNSGTVYEVIP